VVDEAKVVDEASLESDAGAIVSGIAAPPTAAGPRIEDVTPKFSDEVPEKQTIDTLSVDNR
jgi:hypothetical protein